MSLTAVAPLATWTQDQLMGMNRHPDMAARMAMMAALVVLGGCYEGEVLPAEARVYDVTVNGDGTEVAFGVDICSRPLVSFTVDEAPDEVRVTAVSVRGPDPDDCALEVARTLDDPLGDRPVIDTSRDEVITRVYDITTGS